MKMPIKLLQASLLCVTCVLAQAQEPKPQSSQAIPAAGARQLGATVRAQAQSIAVVTIAPAANTNAYKPSIDRNEAALCATNLDKISAALEAYRRDHQDVPKWLSDLVPQYLADTNILICPVTTRTGLQSAFGVLDPKIYSSYLYEFTSTAIPEVVKGAWPGPMMTMREWKRQQMKLAGSEVPLVRCLLHDPALNLSVGGKIYESPVFWELNFTNSTTKLEDFSPHQ